MLSHSYLSLNYTKLSKNTCLQLKEKLTFSLMVRYGYFWEVGFNKQCLNCLTKSNNLNVQDTLFWGSICEDMMPGWEPTTWHGQVILLQQTFETFPELICPQVEMKLNFYQLSSLTLSQAFYILSNALSKRPMIARTHEKEFISCKPTI